MYGLMSEQSINETLEAVRKCAEEALKSKENAIEYLKGAGILDENGEPTELYQEMIKKD